RADVVEEEARVGTGLVFETDDTGEGGLRVCVVRFVSEDDALQPGSDRGKRFAQRRRQLAAAGDGEGEAVDGSNKPLAGMLGEVGDAEEGDVLCLSCRADGFGERVLGVTLEAGGEGEEMGAVP